MIAFDFTTVSEYEVQIGSLITNIINEPKLLITKIINEPKITKIFVFNEPIWTSFSDTIVKLKAIITNFFLPHN